MTDSIQSRVMFFDTQEGQVRFGDWNRVNTPLGTMFEPRQLIEVRGARASQFNPNDQCAKVNSLEHVDLKGLSVLLWHDKTLGRNIMGGNLMPRVYCY